MTLTPREERRLAEIEASIANLAKRLSALRYERYLIKVRKYCRAKRSMTTKRQNRSRYKPRGAEQ